MVTKQLAIAMSTLLFAAAASAAQETGKVISVDPTADTFTIETDDGDRITYRSDAVTRIMRDDVAIAFDDLPIGTRVEVTAAEAVGTAPRFAFRVELVPAADPTRLDTDLALAGEDRTERMAGTGPQDRVAQMDYPHEDRADTADVAAGARDDRSASAEPLPQTASPLPLIGLLGGGGVLAGFALRKLRR